MFQTKRDIEKLKTPLRLAWKCCFVAFKIGSTIFSLQGHFNILGEKFASVGYILIFDKGKQFRMILLVPGFQQETN